ncbi:PQQ-dependent sugar dehydrogenase [Bizionia echini]|uniref:PQQ-dependent sugar dehydrogenase n=1 Tax=Bizionia echini TaxID=649333 RepID=UPI0030D70CB4
MKNILSLLVFSIFTIFTHAQQIGIDLYADGFNNPVGIKHANDDRLFIVEKAGVIKIINGQQNVVTTAFLDINSLVSNSGGERGLLGLAFHPNFTSNGYFFVNYINNSGDTVVSRFTVNPTDSNLADVNSELILLTIEQPYGNHNGGDLAFGEDGFLYIATGDGGSGSDPENRSQDLTTLLGKLLRIDVNNSGNGLNYAIPADNPFISNTNALDEIWAYGLRNPWRFSFDRTNNDLWIADVGQFEIEEINKVSATEGGINYGWRCYEGNEPFITGGCPDASTMVFPVSQYTHSNSGEFKCSITGGYIYQGSQFPAFIDTYFFADYCSDEIGTLVFENNTWTMSFTTPFSNKGWTTFGEDTDGELYIAAASTGEIFRIVDTNLSINENSLYTIKIYPNPVADYLTIDALSSTTTLLDVVIYDARGKQIKTISGINKQQINISVAALTSGIYIMEISDTNNNSVTKKFIID